MKTFAFDFETFYDKECTVKTLGNYLYTQHPKFNCYLLSVAGEDGYRWVGNPKDFDWGILRGQRLIAHNAGFELAVTEYLRTLGVVPKDWTWGELHDTADMAAYLGVPRSLEQSALYLLNLKIDKGARDKAKGKNWEDMTPDFQKVMSAYALKDSEIELELWLKHNAKWPQWEKELSTETREMSWRGLPTNREAAEKAAKILKGKLWSARELIPWAEDKDAKILSLAAAKAECRKHNIDPPTSMAKDSPEFEAWLEKYGEKFPWAKAMGEYRSVNILLSKIETLIERTKDDGWMPYGLKYGGAHTMRDSGDSGFNVQNPPRKPMYDVDLRAIMAQAPKDYVLGVADSGQIEPRVLNTLAEDEVAVEMYRKGYDAYEVQARAAHGYDDPRSLKVKDAQDKTNYRQYMKVEVLACGYGAGPEKVQLIAKNQVGLDLTFEEAEKIVTSFRSRRFIPELWQQLEQDMRESAPNTYELELPSGRIMHYHNVRAFGSCSAEISRLGKYLRLKWWGGSLVENLVQATARDVFMWQVLQARKEGIIVLLRAHDEVVTLYPKSEAEAQHKRLLEIMHVSPPWMRELPVTAEGIITPYYKKP